MRHALLTAALVASAAIAAPASAQTVGTANTSNCWPFGCLAYGGGNLYQQVYSASSFAGLTAIDAVSFNRAGAGPLGDTSIAISFYYSPYGPGALTSDPTANRGALLSNFGSYTLGGDAPQTLSFAGNAFTYDPGLGALLMQVDITRVGPNQTYDGFYDADRSGQVTSRYVGFTSGNPIVEDVGLVTQFSSVSPVPEPATWAMMLVGFGGLGYVLRRRGKPAVRFA